MTLKINIWSGDTETLHEKMLESLTCISSFTNLTSIHSYLLFIKNLIYNVHNLQITLLQILEEKTTYRKKKVKL